MKITSIEPYLFNPGKFKNLLFVRIDTDEGIYGWGESYVNHGREKVVYEYIKAMAPHLIGRDPFNIRQMGKALMHDFAFRRVNGDVYGAWSGIEIALWDVVGKAVGQPVYNLLGGRCRERIRVYYNSWSYYAKNNQEVAEAALRVKERGFTALKWDPFRADYWREMVSRKQEDQAVECVRMVREAVGPDVDLLIDGHRRMNPYQAVHFLDRIAQYDIFWFEEPCISDKPKLIREVKRQTHVPIVSGECLVNRAQFRELFETQAVDIINPEISISGILESIAIAEMADAYGIMYTPHTYLSNIVGLAAALHVSATVPNFLICEFFQDFDEATDTILKSAPYKLDNGFLELSEEPGLGIDIDLEKLKQHPYQGIDRGLEGQYFKPVARYVDEPPRKEDYLY